jgi:hypothetical protein
METRGRRLRRAVSAALVALAIGVALPVWKIWTIDRTIHQPSLLSVERRPLWVWARQSVAERRMFYRVLDDNATTGAVVIGMATAIGVAVHWLGARGMRAESAGDYCEGPGGAVPDGRADRPAV